MAGAYQNQVPSLSKLSKYRYENIFKVYIDNDENFFYNLNKSVNFPASLDTTFIDNFLLDRNVPWTTISYNIYGTIYLWWTILEVNRIPNPVIMPRPGNIYRYIKPSKIDTVLALIEDQKNA